MIGKMDTPFMFQFNCKYINLKTQKISDENVMQFAMQCIFFFSNLMLGAEESFC